MIDRKKMTAIFLCVFALFSMYAKTIQEKFTEEWLRDGYIEYESYEESPEGTRLAENEEPINYVKYRTYNSLEELIGDKCLKVFATTSKIYQNIDTANTLIASSASVSKGEDGLYSGIEGTKNPGISQKSYMSYVRQTNETIIRFEKEKKAKYVFVDERISNERTDITYKSLTNSMETRTLSTYQQILYFLRPYTKEEMSEWRFGIETEDLDNYHRNLIKRNAGVYVRIVFSKYPAYYADMFPGDYIIKMNNTNIRNVDDLTAFEKTVKKGDVVTATIIRDGAEKTLKIEI